MKKIPLFRKVQEEFPDYTQKELYAMILCGEVLCDKQVLKNPKEIIPVESSIELRPKKFVSRGGLKLEKAIQLWTPPVKGKVILDAGCSTGGFTDCLLQNGAELVHAVDVGYNQLDYSLRTNPAVRVMEKTNIMHIENLDPQPDWAVADLSFRSIRSAASRIISLTRDKFLISLIKPQFEWRNPDSEFNGVITDPERISTIALEVMEELKDEGAFVLKAAASPVPGRKGNRELLFWISNDTELDYPAIGDLKVQIFKELEEVQGRV